MRRLSWSHGLALILLLENAYLAWPPVRDLALRAEAHPAVRGRQLALGLGCFSCHGPEGRGGVPNHGSKYETVPGFGEQTLMMFVKDEAEVREYIRDGAPQRQRQRAAYQAELAAQALRMPAFGDWLSEAESDALVAYLRLVSGLLRPTDPAITHGEQMFGRLGCAACHGEMGMGGRPNPGSLKGYIPGFLGDDYRELVRDDAELLAWLRDGALARVAEHPLGHYFFERQRVRMPAYKHFVADDDLRAIAAYVRWLAAGAWQEQPLAP
ncbi:MAG: c-type cytochrome [Deltaproteobacteria bacterium]|nr:c-type cytochrome [Deltaproteobacteria bacterium]